jgi:hypothetical protein
MIFEDLLLQEISENNYMPRVGNPHCYRFGITDGRNLGSTKAKWCPVA